MRRPAPPACADRPALAAGGVAGQTVRCPAQTTLPLFVILSERSESKGL